MRKNPKQFYYLHIGLAIQQEIPICKLPDFNGVGHWSYALTAVSDIGKDCHTCIIF